MRSEWTLSVFENGLVIWENVAEDDEPRHRHGRFRRHQLRIGVRALRVPVEAGGRGRSGRDAVAEVDDTVAESAIVQQL